ncbi:hypothetical protein BC833DRAFT_522344 [Globomyces pollinis-pini]|nr:hypothetical protein BC833DRAFT_522344 [Globomyces pollinis-pini]KAJ2996232.1 hypothetical protein HDV02_006701 [Globomyces sp. JEL0801]
MDNQQVENFNHEVILDHIQSEHFKPSRTVLIAVDDSQNTIHSIQFAINHLLNSTTDQIVLIHARAKESSQLYLPILNAANPLFNAYKSSITEFMKHEKTLSNSLLKDLGQMFIQKGFNVRGISTAGDPRLVIQHKIDILHPDFVVMASHGKGMVARAILGSVSSYVLNNSKVPVLIVPFSE